MERIHLPKLRMGCAIQYEYERVPCHAIFNNFPETDDIAEVFLDLGKVGSSMHNIGKEAAVMFSLCRQFGVPLDVIRAALPLLESGAPAGPTGIALAMAEEKT